MAMLDEEDFDFEIGLNLPFGRRLWRMLETRAWGLRDLLGLDIGLVDQLVFVRRSRNGYVGYRGVGYACVEEIYEEWVTITCDPCGLLAASSTRLISRYMPVPVFLRGARECKEAQSVDVTFVLT